jgi:hypothetical protein
MAITKNTVQVNNGNTGWTRSNVLDALEETFADLNWNSGSQQNGVVSTCCYPGDNTTPWNSSPYNGAWRTCGGSAVYSRDIETVRYLVTDTGTEFNFSRYYYGVTGSTSSEYLTIGQHSLSAGASFRYEPKDPANPISASLSGGETVYVSIHDTIRVKLHLTESDALSETNAVDLTNVTAGHYLYTDVIESSPAELKQSDTLELWTGASNLTVPLYIQDSSGVYDADREINNTNYQTAIYRYFPIGQGIQNADNYLTWETRGWEQNEADDPNGYLYITSTTASYSVSLNLAPASGRVLVYTDYGIKWAYWDYTVPADGTRSALNLRIFRNNEGYIIGVSVLDLNSSGWSDGDIFTIPGDQIGGATPANDITFGVNTPETSSNARDGIPSVRVVNIGSGVNSYLKMPSSDRLMLRLENDGTKNYGTTFWLFKLLDDYRFEMRSGIDVDIRNYNPNSPTETDLGRYGGDIAMDWSGSQGTEFSTTNYPLSFASNSTPTAYPLKIVTYKAQAPQDTNFAIIQFIQTVNGDDIPYTTFFLNKGTSYGNGIWDLDHVWQGSYSRIYSQSNDRAIHISTRPANYQAAGEAPTTSSALKREALYGYLREPGITTEGFNITFANNQYNDNQTDQGSSYYSTDNQEVVQYFRNDSYDDYTNNAWENVNNSGNRNDYVNYFKVSDQANYYRPIKGLPISNVTAPIPYYLPDDFVMIDFNVNPGLVQFYPGDTVTISPSEVYEVIYASYLNSQTTYDGIASNTTNGILFCARTT